MLFNAQPQVKGNCYLKQVNLSLLAEPLLNPSPPQSILRHCYKILELSFKAIRILTVI